jgi:hypothetical protein
MTASDFDEIADELYGTRPDEFTQARDEHIARAKADGDKSLARDLGKLRRPTQAAWLVNALWRDSREQIEELLALTDDFGAAMAAGDGKQLQALTSTRRELESRLVQRATDLADDASQPANPDMLREVQETLSAALVSPDAAEQVRSGRLVRPLSYSGFGPGLSAVGQVRSAQSRTRAAAPDAERPAASRSRSSKATKPDAAEAQRKQAEHELVDAEEMLAAAADEYENLNQQLAELRDKIRELDQQVAAAKQAAAREQRRREQAEKAYAKASTAVERAQQRLG